MPVTGEAAPSGKRRHERAGRYLPDAGGRLEKLDLLLEVLLRVLLQHGVVPLDGGCQLLQVPKHRLELPRHARGYRVPGHLVEARGVALRDEHAVRLAQAAHRVDGLRPLRDRHVAQLDDLHHLVALVVAQLHGVEQLAVGAGELRDQERVVLVVLLLAHPDRGKLAGVSHDHVAAARLRERADPAATETGLHRHRRVRVLLEERRERLRPVIPVFSTGNARCPSAAVAGRPRVLFGGFIETALPIGLRMKRRFLDAANCGGIEFCEGEALGAER